MNQRFKIFAIGTLLSATPGLTFAQCLDPFSWKWWSNTAYDDDQTTGPGIHPETYSYAISQGAVTFLNTNIDLAIGPNGEGEVDIINLNLGAFMTGAYVRTWSGSLECTEFWGFGTRDNGDCNGTSLKADSGDIVFNDYHLSDEDQTILQLFASHEIGHIFGLGHPNPNNCSISSFMYADIDYGMPFNLHSTEVTWINTNYP